jgi:hypothetical protein
MVRMHHPCSLPRQRAISSPRVPAPTRAIRRQIWLRTVFMDVPRIPAISRLRSPTRSRSTISDSRADRAAPAGGRIRCAAITTLAIAIAGSRAAIAATSRRRKRPRGPHRPSHRQPAGTSAQLGSAHSVSRPPCGRTTSAKYRVDRTRVSPNTSASIATPARAAASTGPSSAAWRRRVDAQSPTTSARNPRVAGESAPPIPKAATSAPTYCMTAGSNACWNSSADRADRASSTIVPESTPFSIALRGRSR